MCIGVKQTIVILIKIKKKINKKTFVYFCIFTYLKKIVFYFRQIFFFFLNLCIFCRRL